MPEVQGDYVQSRPPKRQRDEDDPTWGEIAYVLRAVAWDTLCTIGRKLMGLADRHNQFSSNQREM